MEDRTLTVLRGRPLLALPLAAVLFLPFFPGSAPAGEIRKFDLADPPDFASRREELDVRQGLAYAEKGDQAKALELFDRAVKENPSSVALDLSGQVCEASAREGIIAWDRQRRRLNAIHPGDLLPPLDQNKIGKEERQALDFYSAAVRARPKVPALQSRLGSALLNFGGDPAQASGHLVIALELRPEETADRLVWIDAAISGGGFDQARGEVERMKGDNKLSPETASFFTGRIEFEQKNFLKSIEEFNRASGGSSPPGLAQYYTARAYEALPQRDAALRAYRLFIRQARPVTLEGARQIIETMQHLERLKRSPEKDTHE